MCIYKCEDKTELILSSCDFRNENSRQAILDNLPKPIDKCKVLFIPNEKATMQAIQGEMYYLRMQEFGFVRKNILVFDYWNAEQFFNLDIDIIYISGGNTFKTLQRIRDCGFDKEIINYVKSGVIYIGGSAGAHIASVNIKHVASFDSVPDAYTNFSGLGLFDGILVCHYTPDRKPMYDKLQADGKYKVFTLTNDESLVIK